MLVLVSHIVPHKLINVPHLVCLRVVTLLRTPLKTFPHDLLLDLFFANSILFKAIPIWKIKWCDIILELDLEDLEDLEPSKEK